VALLQPSTARAKTSLSSTAINREGFFGAKGAGLQVLGDDAAGGADREYE
jgi:hypothetical protein